MTEQLDGRVAVVTGGAGGIGQAIVSDLAAMGARVVVADIDLPAALAVATAVAAENSVAMTTEDKGRVVAREVDLADESSVAGLAGWVADELGGADVVVNNGGIAVVERFGDSSPDTWDRLYRINLRAAMQLTQAVLPGMTERGFGRLVYVSSDGARAGASGEAAYAASKAGLFGFAKSIAREVGRYGVTANVVCPGPTDTPMTRAAMADKPQMLAKLEKAIPLRRIGQPADVAGLVAFLAGRRADYLTGQVLSVSGGITMQ